MIGAGISFYRQAVAEQVITLGLQAWYDFSDLASISLSGNAIISASDKSGNGRTISAPASGNRPTRIPNAYNGRAVAQFDGSFDYLTCSFAEISLTTFSLFAVFKVTTGGSFPAPFTIEKPTFQTLIRANIISNNLSIGERNPSINELVINDPMAAFKSVSFTRLAGFTQKARVNLGAYTSGAWVTPSLPVTNITLGNRIADLLQPFGGDFGELLIYDRSLSDAEMDFMTSYLINKWGL